MTFGRDPFAIDTTLGWFMGFDPRLMPILEQRDSYLGPAWGDFDLETLASEVDGVPTRVLSSPINLEFAPPPGWRQHIERERRLAV